MFDDFIGHVLLEKLEGESNYDTKCNPLCWLGCRGEVQNSLRQCDLTLILALQGRCPLMLLKMYSNFADPSRNLGTSLLFGLGPPPLSRQGTVAVPTRLLLVRPVLPPDLSGWKLTWPSSSCQKEELPMAPGGSRPLIRAASVY